MRSQPWWQSVTTLEGDAAARTETVAIDDGALQWRVSYRCEEGRLLVTVGGEDVVDAACPGEGVGYSTVTGDVAVAVAADGPWHLEVDQQVDVPLAEPPLPEMTAAGAEVVAAGEFYGIERRGTGQVTVYGLPEGGHALRLEDFFVTPNVDLDIRLSPLAAPQTTDEFLSADAAVVARLDITAGSMNFTMPDDVDPADYGSVVIWCPPLRLAYAAASLEAR